MSAWRKIVVRRIAFTWRYGRSFVIVRREGIVVAKPSLTGRSWDTLERAHLIVPSLRGTSPVSLRESWERE